MVSGLPYITPIFMRSWLMKMTMHFERLIEPVSLRKRLAHQARLEADVAVAHLALDFGARHQRGDRIDHQHVDRVRAHQRVDDLERLLAGVGLRHDQFVDVDAQFLGIAGVERMLGVDEGGGPAKLLRFGDDVERERGLARAFGAVDLDHAAARQAADAKRDVEPEAAGRDDVDLGLLAAAELHRRALAERAIDLRERCFQCLLTIRAHAIPTFDDLELRCHEHDPCIHRAAPRRPARIIAVYDLFTVNKWRTEISCALQAAAASAASMIGETRSMV